MQKVNRQYPFCAIILTAALSLSASPVSAAPVDLTIGQAAPAPAQLGGGPDVPQTIAPNILVLDNFNRADGPIGPNWVVQSGSCNVSNNAAVCSDGGRATFSGASGTGDVAEADVATNGTALQYTGLLLNYGAGVSNLFLKVQQQSGDGLFHKGGCYVGNNSNGFGLGFFDLDSPFATAHMKATRVGNDVTIEFTNIDGGTQSPQSYVCSNAPAPEGTGIGIVGYAGYARLDNFAGPASPIASVQAIPALDGTGLGLLVLLLTGAAAVTLRRLY